MKFVVELHELDPEEGWGCKACKRWDRVNYSGGKGRRCSHCFVDLEPVEVCQRVVDGVLVYFCMQHDPGEPGPDEDKGSE